MGFLVGRAWPAGGGKAHAALMDHVGGSAGLHELVTEWAKEFIRQWEAEHAGSVEQDYASHLYTFTIRKFDQLRESAKSAA
ncbi:hypothetical protein [Cupriavidus sp. TMH.W2]|uniref:hypothetical protein n=1 Tax=Cupriavidus sp. TMH.W2 TaxID=3434465 RepID=UPI003D787C46